MNHICFPLPLFRRHLRELAGRPERPILCPAGISRWSDTREILVAREPTGQALLLSHTDRFLPPDPVPRDSVGALLIGRQQQRGQAIGFIRIEPDRVERIHRLRLIGVEMQSVDLVASIPEETAMPEARYDHAATGRDEERWSRTIGALGHAVWERLIGLRCALVGVGRTGASLAISLARLGVRDLTLIDPDGVELHNLGEMPGLISANIGTCKAHAVAATLDTVAGSRLRVTSVASSVTRREALRALQAADVLFCCTDHDGARLAATAAAVLFCKPLIDTATAIHGAREIRQMGVDVRLVLPGRCLRCFGGLRDELEGRRVLASADVEQAVYAQREWNRERAGSLYSLNQLASALALQLWQDLVAGVVGESLWAHAELAAGRLTVSYPQPEAPVRGCPLCRFSGWGDAGLPHLVRWFRESTPDV
jgi:hypothetical protein